MQRNNIKQSKCRTGWLLYLLLLSGIFISLPAFSQDGDSQSSVAQFQQWLREQDAQNQQAVANAASSQETAVVDSNAQNSAGESDISQQAFSELKKQTMPLSLAQMEEFKQLVQNSDRVSQGSTGTPPKPVSSTLVVNLAPGATPPAVRLSQGFISSLVFVDSSGAPWPIEAIDLGNPTAFKLQWDSVSNIIMIQPLETYTYANLALRLKGLTTPVMLTLVPGQAEVDYRVDLRVSGVGPNSTGQATSMALPEGADPVLLNVLDGIPPSGSTELTVRGVKGQAWSSGDTLYLRVKSTVLSPGWIDQMVSPDGTHAYALPMTPTVLISYHGKPIEVQIEDNISE